MRGRYTTKTAVLAACICLLSTVFSSCALSLRESGEKITLPDYETRERAKNDEPSQSQGGEYASSKDFTDETQKEAESDETAESLETTALDAVCRTGHGTHIVFVNADRHAVPGGNKQPVGTVGETDCGDLVALVQTNGN